MGPDDVDEALSRAQGRAVELECTVRGLLDTARYAPDWRTRECVLGWTEDAYRDAKGITKELRSHISLVEVRVEGGCCLGERVEGGVGQGGVFLAQGCLSGVGAGGGDVGEGLQECMHPKGSVSVSRTDYSFILRVG